MQNDSSCIIDSCSGCGRRYTNHPIAKNNNAEDLAPIKTYPLSILLAISSEIFIQTGSFL